MKRFFAIAVAIFFAIQGVAQTPIYTWVSGDTIPFTQSNILKTYPGPRSGSIFWVDSLGNFWLHGGDGYSKKEQQGNFNDMWRLDAGEQRWDWLQGNLDINQESGLTDNGLRFDGKNDAVIIDTIKNYRSDFTWEAWVNFTSDQNNSVLSYDDEICCPVETNGFALMVNPYQLIFATTHSGWWYSQQPSYMLNDGKWHHVAVTVEINLDGNPDEEIKFFIDGEQYGYDRFDFDDLIDDTDTTLYVTKIGDSEWDTFNGLIDNAAIWKTFLSPEDIKNNYATTPDPTDPNLVSFFDFNQGIRDGDNGPGSTSTPTPQIVMFEKLDFVDWTLPENQDQIKPDIAITRADNQGIFNIALSTQFFHGFSPSRTLWGSGPTGTTPFENYVDWRNALNTQPSDIVGETYSMYLEDYNEFWDVEFTGWTQGAGGGVPNGGGFAYTRTEVVSPSTYDSLVDRTPNLNHGRLVNFEDRPSFLNGTLAEVRVWDVVRTQAEIVANQNSLTGTEPGLRAYYNFSEGMPAGDNTALNSIIDQTANNFDGDIFNLARTGTVSNYVTANLPSATVNGLNFDAKGDFVDIQGLDSYQTDMTWEAWVNTVEDGTVMSYNVQGEDISWNLNGATLFILDGFLSFDVFNVGGPWQVGPIIADGTWHHVAITIEKDQNGAFERVIVYIDGASVFDDNGTYDFDPFMSNPPGMGFVTKIGYTSSNFPEANIATGGLTAGSVSNWSSGLSANAVSSRTNALAMTDSNDQFWLFGGFGVNKYGDEAFLNDLYLYDKADNEWDITHEPGTASGVYGTLGVADPGNYPGARNFTSGWVDDNDDLWLFGGYGVDKNDVQGWLMDLWKYDVTNGTWTWMAGADTVNSVGTYGTQGVPGIASTPPPRDGHSTWVDENGLFWLFGGAGEFGLFNDLWTFNPSTSEWTWVGGSNQEGQEGTYGLLQVEAPTNQPGARTATMIWYEPGQPMYLFGGFGKDKNGISDAELNDFWRYDFSTSNWTWMGGPDFGANTGDYGNKGIPSVSNIPGARARASAWIGRDSNFWMFGGLKDSFKSDRYNDLWKYDPSSGEWTWVDGVGEVAETFVSSDVAVLGSGSNQFPGGRDGATEWVDPNGNLFLLGGGGYTNDLWKFEPQNDRWEYIRGSLVEDSTLYNYGTKGIPDVQNVPQGRWHAGSWATNDNKLWFFGGIIRHPTQMNGIAWANDFWNYNIETNEFTWIGGSEEADQVGTYGTKGVPSQNNIPGARSSTAHWKDKNDKIYLFGGYESFEYYNDLWRYDPETNEWVWLTGRNSQNIPGNYGTKGVADPTNEIGSRRYMSAWVDNDNNFYVFGGQGVDSRGVLGYLSDLWKYEPQSNQWTWIHGPDTASLYTGNYGVQGIPAPENYPPGRYAYNTWTDDSGNLWLQGGWPLDTSPARQYNDLWKFDVRTNMWTWVAGSNDTMAPVDSNYGIKGVGSPGNIIGSRERASTFTGHDNVFWLFGGRGNFNGSFSARGSDLWRIDFVPGIPLLDSVTNVTQTGFRGIHDEAWAEEFLMEVSGDMAFTDIVQTLTGLESDTTDVDGLDPGTTYYYRVKSINQHGEGGFSLINEVLTIPATPQLSSLPDEVITDLTSTSLTINWLAVAETLDGYYIDISSDSSFQNSQDFVAGYEAKAISDISIAEGITGLSSGSQYYARIRSYNVSGESENSTIINILTLPDKPLVNPASEITQDGAVLSWTQVPNIVDNYYVDVSFDPTFVDDSAFIAGYNQKLIGSAQLQESLANLFQGSTCYARIFAANSSGSSEPSETITILTLPETPLFLGEDFISNVTQSSARIEWSQVAEVLDGYELEISTDPLFTSGILLLEGYGKNGILQSIIKDSIAHNIPILAAGQTYYARVRSYNSSGASPFSNIIEVATVPEVPVLNDVINIEQAKATLSWEAPEGATAYVLHVSTTDTFDSASMVITNLPVVVNFVNLEELDAGTRYYVRVESGNSSGRTGLLATPLYGITEFITVPDIPFIADPVEIGQTSASVTWSNSQGTDSFEFDASDNGFQTFLPGFNALVVNDSTVEVTGLTPGEFHQLRVRAINESGTTDNSPTLNLQTVPPTPLARDASSVTTKSFRANWDPVNGATFYVLEVSGDDFASFVYQDTSFVASPVDLNNLETGVTFKYRVRSGNESGQSPNSDEISVLTANQGQAFAVSDLSFDPNFRPTTSSSDITINLTGGQGNLAASMRHRGLASDNWSNWLLMESIGGGNYSFTILPGMLDDIGVQFEVNATDGFDTIPKSGSMVRVFDNIQSPAVPFAIFGEQSWQMFSIPFVLEDNLIETIFNELGPLRYKFDWRLVHYQNGGYVDFGEGINRIELGRGYWFTADEAEDIQIGEGTNNNQVPFEISLASGWNQIGNPFNTVLNWNGVIAQNPDVSLDLLYFYNTQTKAYQTGTSFEPFAGAFLWSDSDATISISPNGNSGTQRIKRFDISSRNIDEANWLIPIELTSGNVQIELAAFGMHVEAVESKDPFDRMQVPRFMHFLEMYTTHPEALYSYFSRDVVPPTNEKSWKFKFETNILEKNATLLWDNSSFQKASSGLWLLDETAGKIIDMKVQNSYEFGPRARDFTVYFSSNPDQLPIPGSLILGDAYPNPGVKSTTIPVTLPETQDSYHIEISVFDIRGEKVDTIVEGVFTPGFHEFLWNNINDNLIPNGVYIYSLRIKDFETPSIQKRLVIQN